MKRIRAFAVSIMLGMPLPALSQDAGSTDAFVAMGAYVPSDDIARSAAFYAALFDRAPVIHLDDFVAFDIAGGWFAIVSRERYAPGSTPGSGAIPYIQANDLNSIRAHAISAPGGSVSVIIDEPGIRLLKVYDPEGQLVEFFLFAAN